MEKSLNPNVKHMGGFNQRPTGTQQNLNQRPSSAPMNSNSRQQTFSVQNQRPVQQSNLIHKSVNNQSSMNRAAVNQVVNTQNNVVTDHSKVGNSPTDDMAAFVSNMKNMVGSFAYISDDVVANNMQLASGHGMTIDDRKIPFECAQYIMCNFAFICMGLVFDADFKEAFVHAVTAEQNIDALSDEEKKQIRASMTDPNPYQSEGSIILGMTTFTPTIDDQLHKEMMAGFDKLSPYANEFDEAVYALSDQDKIENGFIFSNWMYLIRAFTHNDMFMSYVITVIDKVKETIGVK